MLARGTRLEPATSGVAGRQHVKQHQPLFRMSIAAWLPKTSLSWDGPVRVVAKGYQFAVAAQP
jgi:hypothetical protein